MSGWIVILIVLSLMGSVFWIMPSTRDRQRMVLRQEAMRNGLKVRFPDKGLKDRLIRYEDAILGSVMYECYIRSRRKPLIVGNLVLVRDEHSGAWAFRESSLPLGVQGVAEDILGALNELPKSITLALLTSNGVSVFWDERGEEKDVGILLSVMELVNGFLVSPA